ncbi:MAG: acyltransferase [Bacteroidota bacterium]
MPIIKKSFVKGVIERHQYLRDIGQQIIYNQGGLTPRWWVRNILNRFFHKIGKKTKIRKRLSRHDLYPWHKFVIGDHSTIECFTVLNNGAGDLIIGKDVLIGIGSIIVGPVTIGDHSGTGQHVFISGFNHSYDDPAIETRLQPLDKKPVVLGIDVHIGSNSVVLSGVTIGDKTQIGAGSVVTKDIPSYCVAAGNPAKILKKYNFETRLWEPAC